MVGCEARELRLSPVVRKIAREHRVDVRNIAGSGAGGRVTKSDILAYIDAGAPPSASAFRLARCAAAVGAAGQRRSTSAGGRRPNVRARADDASCAGRSPSTW